MNLTNEPHELLIDFHQVKKASLIIRAINNSYRQRIYNFLIVAGNSTVSNIITNLGLKQSVVSQHLAILRKAKIVSYLKKGKFVYYHVNGPGVVDIQNFINKLLENNKPPLLRKEG